MRARAISTPSIHRSPVRADFKFGKAPQFASGAVEVPDGGIPFSPVNRRYEAYKTYSPRLDDALAAIDGELRTAVAAGDFAAVVELTRPRTKGDAGTPVSQLPYVIGLLSNQCLQSENEGTTNANLLARYMANEIAFAVRDMNAAAAARDSKGMLLGYALLRRFTNTSIQLLNMVITPKIGAKFAQLS